MLETYGFHGVDLSQHAPSDGDIHGAITRRLGRLQTFLHNCAPITFVTGLAVESDASGMLNIFNQG